MIAVALAVWGTACSAPPAATPEPAHALCFGRAPQAWSSATATVPGTFGAHAVEGDVVFGQLTGTGVASLELTSGKVSTVAGYEPGVSGLGALAVEPPWVVWEQLNSTTNLSDWSVYALNRDTGERRELAGSRLPGGGFVAGQQPLPVLRHGVVAWAQPVRGANGAMQAELRTVDLTTRQALTLDSGRLSSPVYAGPYLVWAKIVRDEIVQDKIVQDKIVQDKIVRDKVEGSSKYSLHAVDAATLRPVELPEPLRQPGSVGYLGGSPGYLVWSSHDSMTLNVWEFGARRRGGFTTDRRHAFQFLQVAGDLVHWYGGLTSSVLDLRSGAAFDLAGTVAGSAGWIVAAAPLGTDKDRPMTRVSRIATRDAARGAATC